MNNRVYIPATKPEDWRYLLAEPDKHRRDGYSAKSLAYSWQQAEGFPVEVNKALADSGHSIFNDIELLLAIPEYKVPLPGGGNPSQNDIFVLARGNDQLIAITVEGKVSEPFGPLVSEWFENPSDGKKKRLVFLCETLGLDQERLGSIRYQLLHRTASALIEAKRFNASNALMLVHSFSQTGEWFEDYATFAGMYGIDPETDNIHKAIQIDGISLFLGWVKGEMKEQNDETSTSTVTARKCEFCGHHEIGIVDESGEYRSLRPGTKITINKMKDGG
jgi:hypothetical protein